MCRKKRAYSVKDNKERKIDRQIDIYIYIEREREREREKERERKEERKREREREREREWASSRMERPQVRMRSQEK